MANMTDHEQTFTEPVAKTPEHQVRGTGWIASKVPLLCVVGVALVFHSQMDDMAVGSLTDPGPGFWPRVLIIGLIVTSLLGLCVDLTDGIEPFDKTGTLRMLAGFAALCLFVLVFQNTGMILAGMLLLMLWLKGLNGESWRLSVLISVVGPFLTYLLFVEALGVRFPEDLVASLWGGR